MRIGISSVHIPSRAVRCRQSSDPAGVLQTTKPIRRYIVGSNHSFHRRFRRELCHFRKELAVKLRKVRQKRKAYKRRKPACRLIFLAQREGFEPSSGFSRYTISNRARYDLFDTAANRWRSHNASRRCSAAQRRLLYQLFSRCQVDSSQFSIFFFCPTSHTRSR